MKDADRVNIPENEQVVTMRAAFSGARAAADPEPFTDAQRRSLMTDHLIERQAGLARLDAIAPKR